MDLNPKQVAERLKTSKCTINRWIRAGVFPHAYKLNPMAEQSHIRIPEEDVIALETARARGLNKEVK